MVPMFPVAVHTQATTYNVNYLIGFAIVIPIVVIVMGCFYLCFTDGEGPRVLRPLRTHLRQWTGLDEADAAAAHAIEPLENPEIGPGLTYQQMLMLNPEGDPGLAAALMIHSQNIARQDSTRYTPRHARRVTPEPLPTRADLTLLCLEIDLHLGFQPDVRTTAVHVTRRQLRALEEFCGLRYAEIRTPAQVFGLHGLAVEVN